MGRVLFSKLFCSKCRCARRQLMMVVLLLVALCFQTLTACSDDDTIVYRSNYHWVDKTVAIVAPLSNADTKKRLERTANWFLDNFYQAQLRDSLCIRLHLEWFDEQSNDMTTLSQTLVGRDDVVAIIGPFSNDNLAAFAPACQKTNKTVIAPTATSEDVIRRFAVAEAGISNKSPFLWSLTETDVAFSEVLLSLFATDMQYYSGGNLKVHGALFAPDNVYGRTFSDWAPYQAENMNVSLFSNSLYKDSQELKELITNYFDVVNDYSNDWFTNNFCVVESIQQIYDVVLARLTWYFPDTDDATEEINIYEDCEWVEEINRTWFAYSGLSEEELSNLGPIGVSILQGYQGFSPYADPTTGFEQSYESRFGVLPTFAECKFYDALMLAAFALCYAEHTQTTNVNNAILAITNDVASDVDILSGPAWNITTMEVYLNSMEHGRLLKFRGASGDICFDRDTYTSSTHTTYVHWRINDGKIHHLDYFGSDGSKRVSESTAAWRWFYDESIALAELAEQAEDKNTGIVYPAMSDQYAVLVQGSNGFGNYRHQADVLAMYQMLRRNGFDDDHIILIIDEALSADVENDEKGVIRSAVNGPDLLGGTTSGYFKAAVDYDNVSLKASDVANILLGIKTVRTPVVLPVTEQTAGTAAAPNILFYWSGHGRCMSRDRSDEFRWCDDKPGDGFTAAMMKETVSTMQQQQLFRKMLVIAEPCYAEVVVSPLQGIKGVLAMSGASASEQSFADHWNSSLGKYGTWMCDRFSSNLIDYLTANPKTTYRDLFLYCAQHTLGSHAKIINAANFDNLYVTGPQEFVFKQP